MSELAGRIRKARVRMRLTQRELAILLGVTRGAVANWESANAALPATERLQRIAHATGVNFEWLATGRGVAGYQASREENLGTGLEIVIDTMELRLLRLFRASPLQQHARIIAMLEALYITALELE